MNIFRLSDIAQHLASRQRARGVRDEIVAAVASSGGKVTIDLTEILSISDSFADELFGVLANTQGDAWFQRHIDVKGATDVVRGSIVRAIRARLDRESTKGRPSGASGYSLAPPPERLS